MYRSSTRIFMMGDSESWELRSCEGTTQGCPLAMAMYALAVIPVTKLNLCKQVWYADDAGCDTFENLFAWFNALKAQGPRYGYFPKPEKCILLTKPDRVELARKVFLGSGVVVESEGSKDSVVVGKTLEINNQGARHLGAAIGAPDFRQLYVRQKISSWVKCVEKLSLIAMTQPHAAFSAFTHCLQCQWTFLSRAMPDVAHLFKPLEDSIVLTFLPALLRREVSSIERELMSLPARFGGLGIFNPTDTCDTSHNNSVRVTEPLVNLIMSQNTVFDPTLLQNEVSELRKEVDKATEKAHKEKLESVKSRAPALLQASIKIALEKGASSWVTAIPSYDHGTILHKGEFIDAIYIRYGWTPLSCPRSVRVEHPVLMSNMLLNVRLEAIARSNTTKSVT
jgi:hypothetical protein